MVGDELHEVRDELAAESFVRCDGHEVLALSATAERDDDFRPCGMPECDHFVEGGRVVSGIATQASIGIRRDKAPQHVGQLFVRHLVYGVGGLVPFSPIGVVADEQRFGPRRTSACEDEKSREGFCEGKCAQSTHLKLLASKYKFFVV